MAKYSVPSFSLMKKKQKIKAVPMADRTGHSAPRTAMQRALSKNDLTALTLLQGGMVAKAKQH